MRAQSLLLTFLSLCVLSCFWSCNPDKELDPAGYCLPIKSYGKGGINSPDDFFMYVYEYDDKRRPVKISYASKSLSDTTYQYQIEYNSGGQVSKIDYHQEMNLSAFAFTTTYSHSYNDKGQISWIEIAELPGKRILTYQYDGIGNCIKIIESFTNDPYINQVKLEYPSDTLVKASFGFYQQNDQEFIPARIDSLTYDKREEKLHAFQQYFLPTSFAYYYGNNEVHTPVKTFDFGFPERLMSHLFKQTKKQLKKWTCSYNEPLFSGPMYVTRLRSTNTYQLNSKGYPNHISTTYQTRPIGNTAFSAPFTYVSMVEYQCP